jgi:hypothetical protein
VWQFSAVAASGSQHFIHQPTLDLGRIRQASAQAADRILRPGLSAVLVK